MKGYVMLYDQIAEIKETANFALGKKQTDAVVRQYIDEKVEKLISTVIGEIVDLTNGGTLTPEMIVNGIHSKHRHLQALFMEKLVESMDLYSKADNTNSDARNEGAKETAKRMHHGAMCNTKYFTENY
jgi:hypothetical protein